MATRNVLVIGANRGLGLGLLKVFKENGYNVSGTIRPQTRHDSSFKDLAETSATVIDLDYLDEASIAAAAKIFGEDRALDVLVNCAGVDVYPESWLDTTPDLMIEKYRVMTLGPFLAMRHFLPNLRKSPFGKIINITSDFASITINDTGNYVGYRVAKTALNALSVSVAMEMKTSKENIAVLCLDPGDVPTRLSRWTGDINLEESVRGLYNQVERATMEDSGSFLNWKGHRWPY